MVVALAVSTSCVRDHAGPAPSKTSEPTVKPVAPQPAPSVETPPVSDDPIADDDSQKWLHVIKLRDEGTGGFAIGRFVPPDNKIVIDTDNVARFNMDTERIPIDWTHRVVLRIDGESSELIRKEDSTVSLQRTDAGNWVAVDD